MTLTTLYRAPTPRLSPHAARDKVTEAAARLQAAIDALWLAEQDEATRAAKIAIVEAQARTKIREAERARRPHALTMDRRWIGEFADAMNAIAFDARKDGDTAQAQAIGRLVDMLGAEVERIERRITL
jgi:hypothetical protein